MRYHEIASGLRINVSNEERDVMNKIGKGLPINQLEDERDQEVASMLFRRGLLNKFRDKDGNIVYKQNSVNDIWLGRDF